MAREMKPAIRIGFIASASLSLLLMGKEVIGNEIFLADIDSGLTSPTGDYRWLDVGDQLYSESYRNSYNYTQATVSVTYHCGGPTFQGRLTANNLKPNFAYQVKLVGYPGTPANERIGLAGRWWQEEWNGSAWTNGQNLNNKGDGYSPSPNDDIYLDRRDDADSSSPTGLHSRYTGYLVFDYFIADPNGNAILDFEADSSYHVLWKTSQRAQTGSDGPLHSSTFDADPSPSSAYDVDYPPITVSIFGEWERLPVGGVFPQPGTYLAQIILTEESFHGSGRTYAGNWAGAMGADIEFTVAEDALAGDGDMDGDVDGSDLAALIAHFSSIDLPTFARNFGRNTCQ
jgi:hypothetical protein